MSRHLDRGPLTTTHRLLAAVVVYTASSRSLLLDGFSTHTGDRDKIYNNCLLKAYILSSEAGHRGTMRQ